MLAVPDVQLHEHLTERLEAFARDQVVERADRCCELFLSLVRREGALVHDERGLSVGGRPLSGPVGRELLNLSADSAGADWTNDNALTMEYDIFKVAAVLNEIKGLDHSGASHVGTPAIFGMNFQTVSTAEKLPTSQGQPGGYLADGVTPGPVLMRALDFINTEVGSMILDGSLDTQLDRMRDRLARAQ